MSFCVEQPLCILRHFINIHIWASFSRGNGRVTFNSLKSLSFGNADVNLHTLGLITFLVTPEPPSGKRREISQLRVIGTLSLQLLFRAVQATQRSITCFIHIDLCLSEWSRNQWTLAASEKMAEPLLNLFKETHALLRHSSPVFIVPASNIKTHF